jgi:hypothetical protein
MSNIITPNLYRLCDGLPREGALAASVAGLVPDEVYWLMGSRRSSLGGYLGRFEGVYKHALGISPDGETVCENIPMRYLTPVVPRNAT